jgi:hypothetical protein
MASRIARLRGRVEFMVIPLWAAMPLVWLGVSLTLIYPLGVVDGSWTAWVSFGLVLAGAVYFGFSIHRKYKVTVLERSERGVVYWVQRVKPDEEKPVSRVVMPRQQP